MEDYWWFALKCVPMVGNVTFRRLLEKFGTPERVLHASEAELVRTKGVSAAAVAAIRSHDYRPFAEQECAGMARSGAADSYISG